MELNIDVVIDEKKEKDFDIEKYLIKKDNSFVFNPIYVFDEKCKSKRIHKIKTLDLFIEFLSFTKSTRENKIQMMKDFVEHLDIMILTELYYIFKDCTLMTEEEINVHINVIGSEMNKDNKTNPQIIYLKTV